MERSAFVIDDRKWTDVLALVPLTIWTEPPSRRPLLGIRVASSQWLQGDDVASTRMLRFGSVRETGFSVPRTNLSTRALAIKVHGPLKQPPRDLCVKMEGGESHLISFPPISLARGKTTVLHVADDGTTYKDARLQKLARRGTHRRVHQTPTLVCHREAKAMDADAAIDFLRCYSKPDQGLTVTLVGDMPLEFQEPLRHLGFPVEIRTEPGVAGLIKAEANAGSRETWVVAAREDYRTGLTAAVFAAWRNGLVFFADPDNLGDYDQLQAQGRDVYFVGDVARPVKQHFERGAKNVTHWTREELEENYLAETLTDKVIVVNPRDVLPSSLTPPTEDNPSLLRLFEQGGPPTRVYDRISLAAPFLAAAKHESILPIDSTDPYVIDHSIDLYVQRTREQWGIDMHFLTLVASPEVIPMAIPLGINLTTTGPSWIELDGRYYASVGRNEEEVDLAVGRIFGVTCADSVAHVMRVLFYADLARSDPAAQKESKALLIMLNDDEFQPIQGRTSIVSLSEDGPLRERLHREYFTNEIALKFAAPPAEYLPWDLNFANPDSAECHKRYRSDYQSARLILYCGHADYTGITGINTGSPEWDDMWLNFPIIIGTGCSTGAYHQMLWEKLFDKDARNRARDWVDDRTIDPPLGEWPYKVWLTRLFAVQNIRRGAMAVQCSVGPAYWNKESGDLLHAIYVDRLPIGEAFRRAKNREYERDRSIPAFENHTSNDIEGDPHYLLIGDPTFSPLGGQP